MSKSISLGKDPVWKLFLNFSIPEYFNGLEGVNSGREVQGKIKALHN